MKINYRRLDKPQTDKKETRRHDPWPEATYNCGHRGAARKRRGYKKYERVLERLDGKAQAQGVRVSEHRRTLRGRVV